jgi:hypothetical protein
MYATEVVRHVTPCKLVSVYRRSVEACYLHIQELGVQQ